MRSGINQRDYAVISKINRFAIYDGPGIRTTIFFKGCPLRCWWCSNPETQEKNRELIYNDEKCNSCYRCVKNCPYGAITPVAESSKNHIAINREICRDKCFSMNDNFNNPPCVNFCYQNALQVVGRRINLGSLMSIIMRDRLIYHYTGGGITASGGEPTMQWEFVSRLFKECKSYGIGTALDTCGYVEWDLLDKITNNVDIVLYDIKFIDGELHKKYTGVDNKIILRNARLLSEKAVKNKFQIEVRVPIIPAITDLENNLKEISDFVKLEMKGVNYIKLLPYHRFGVYCYKMLGRKYKLLDIVPPSKDRMEQLRKLLRNEILIY